MTLAVSLPPTQNHPIRGGMLDPCPNLAHSVLSAPMKSHRVPAHLGCSLFRRCYDRGSVSLCVRRSGVCLAGHVLLSTQMFLSKAGREEPRKGKEPSTCPWGTLSVSGASLSLKYDYRIYSPPALPLRVQHSNKRRGCFFCFVTFAFQIWLTSPSRVYMDHSTGWKGKY